MTKKKELKSSINIRLYEEKFLDHLDSEYGFSIAKKLLTFKTNKDGFRLAGTPAENEAADWIKEEMLKIGLKDVTKESFPVDAWKFNSARVDVISPSEISQTLEAGPFTGIKGTSPEGITGEVLYVGAGTKNDYENIDATDKIVLIDTDAYHTYWYNIIFEQAEARGAKAIIATVLDSGPGTYNEDLITVQDVQGFVNIPAVMINKKDGDMLRSSLKNNVNITVNIKSNIDITYDAKGHYVYGKILGKNPESQIMLGGHYDAYWDGFLDNASSLGSMLTIAKAMIDSEYKPENTIVFIINGAEEFGKANCYFDYCTGANAIMKMHPEWIEKTLLYTNFELTAINQIEKFSLTVSGCYNKLFNSLLKQLNLCKEHNVITSSMAGADNIVFMKSGIPSCMNICTSFSGCDPELIANYDHTKYDNIDRFDSETFELNNRIYGLINLIIDNTILIPFDLSAYTKSFWKDIQIDKLKSLYPKFEEVDNEIKEFNKIAETIYEFCANTNLLTLSSISNEESKKIKSDSRHQGWIINKILLKVNKILIKEIYKYNAFSDLIIGHKQPYDYVVSIDDLIHAMETGHINNELSNLESLDNNYLIKLFDKDVYDKTAIYAFDASVPQEWGEGETLKFPNLYNVISEINAKIESCDTNFEDEIDTLKIIRKEQHNLLVETLEKEGQSVMLAKQIMKDIDLNSFR